MRSTSIVKNRFMFLNATT